MNATWAALAACFFLLALPVTASTNSTAGEEEIPALRPPRGEIAPTFWEQHAGAVVLGSVLFVGAASAALWFLLRPRPVAPEPPAAKARHALETLRKEPETGAVLSRVSLVVRHYFAAAFNLPAGELTTAEFCRAIATSDQVGSELSQAVGGFLRECDQRKFAPAAPAAPLEAVPRASRFIDQAEARRAQLTAAAPGA
jgi:hypothetical protein